MKRSNHHGLLILLALHLLLPPLGFADHDQLPRNAEKSICTDENSATDLLKEQMLERLPLDRLRNKAGREPGTSPRVESISWMKDEVLGGDEPEKAVESTSRGSSYLRYVLPVAVILAAGTTTYLLYSVRSR